MQAEAELQGAAAWRGMLTDELPEEVRSGLQRCIELEEASSAYLYSIIAAVREAA